MCSLYIIKKKKSIRLKNTRNLLQTTFELVNSAIIKLAKIIIRKSFYFLIYSLNNIIITINIERD